MKKNILFAALLALATPTVFTSCDDDESEGKSRITYYAILELNGDEYMTTQLGSAFNDPGCTATMGGEDVSDKIVTTGTVNTNKMGFYTLNYSVVNPDGFPASASRTVAVVDKNNFASLYFGESQYGSRHYFNAPISITDNGDGTYEINDLAGGFYCYGRSLRQPSNSTLTTPSRWSKLEIGIGETTSLRCSTALMILQRVRCL